jgi:acid phosphatase type 7
MPRLPLLSALLVLSLRCAHGAANGEPPRFSVAVSEDAPLTFVAYGDTRFTARTGDVANPAARRALVAKMAAERPAAILIGGDLVYQGSDPLDYQVYRRETAAWSSAGIAVFPALGNHEFRGCDHDPQPCLLNWWQAAQPLALQPFRWYSVTLGTRILAVILDSDAALSPQSPQGAWFGQQLADAPATVQFILVVMHYPPVRNPLFPRGKQEKEIARYLHAHAAALHARVVVIGSHVHNYERYYQDGVTYLVSGGGGAKPVPDPRLFRGELSKLRTAVNFHYLRFHLDHGLLSGTMVRFDTDERGNVVWSEPDRFEVRARGD